jgi:hypothetical protein
MATEPSRPKAISTASSWNWLSGTKPDPSKWVH